MFQYLINPEKDILVKVIVSFFVGNFYTIQGYLQRIRQMT